MSAALVLTACGSGDSSQVAQEPVTDAAAAPAEDAPATETAPAAEAAPAADSSEAAPADDAAKAAQSAPKAAKVAKASKAVAPKAVKATKGSGSALKVSGTATAQGGSFESASERAANQKIATAKDGATARGVTKDTIRLGSINAWGMALSSLASAPMVRGNLATINSINDRGGILGRRMTITDCDDGVGDSSRAKACVKKLVNQDKVFALVTAWDWGTASIHDDLAQYKLPYVGSWAYSQTEWQDPWMFPAHMSMIHEAMAEAHWVKNVMKPKTYGLLCLASPEMQLACNEVERILEPTGAKMVKRVNAAVSETSMSPYVLSMRAANPDVIIHYTINPTTIIKFVAESAQQGYWPTKGIAGNHLAAEVLGKLFGKWPVGRYWTNTTYKMWGNGFMSTMEKYAPGNKGLNYHIVQSGYVGINIFAQAAKQVGPNLTAERLRAALGNGAWNTDADLGQTFMYSPGERGDKWRDDTAQGKEYMYKYTSTNTISNPDGSPSGFEPDKDQFVIYTRK